MNGALIVWESFGPYHFSRLDALRASADRRWIGGEIGWRNKTYAWNRHGPSERNVVTLVCDGVAEEASFYRVFLATRRLIVSESIAVVLVPSYWPAYSLAVALAARSCGVALVIMSDSHHSTGQNFGLVLVLKRILISGYGAALVAGSPHRAFFADLGMRRDCIFDGYDSVDNAYFSKRAEAARGDAVALRGKLELPERFVLSLGRLVEKKNLETVVRAYAKAFRDGLLGGAALVFVGSGPQEGLLRGLVPELGLRLGDPSSVSGDNAGFVYFKPFAQADTTPIYYGLATCFVLASHREEWGLVVNEAMASGCPVILSTAVGCARDLVDNNITGLTFDPGNVDELAWCMGRVCGNAELAAKMAAAATVRIGEWSNERFVRNANLAAAAALARKRGTSQWGYSLGGAVVLQQTCFPDYREPVYNRLHRLLGDDFRLVCGPDYFTPDVKTVSRGARFCRGARNRFFASRRFLWQSDAIHQALEAKVAIVELNPRILSNWVILAARKLWGAPTLVWGHTWGREGWQAKRNLVRIMMARLASGIVTYTRSQRDELKLRFPSLPAFCAPNSVTLAEDCYAKPCSRTLPFRILYVGRLNASKRPDLLMRGFAVAAKELPPEAELCIVGAGPQEAELRALLATLPAASQIRLMGHVNNKELLRDLYADAICAVSPGYVGLSAIQSFSFGVPLLLADDELHSPEVEACVEGFNTVRFRARDEQALADGLLRLWRERSAWLAKRDELCRWTADRYSVEAMVDGHLEAIRTVTGTDFVK